MTPLAFDTHSFVKRPVVAGMPEMQAEVIADQQARLIDERLATKDDLEKLRLQLLVQLGGMMAVTVGAVAALIKLV